MNIKKILEYAIVGVQKEEDDYKIRMKQEQCSTIKDYMQEKALSCHKDYLVMRELYIKNSDLLKNWEILL